MLLVDWEIKQLIAEGDIEVSPFDESLINPAGIDFRLSNVFSELLDYNIDFPTACGGGTVSAIDPFDKKTYSFRKIEAESYLLQPGKAILGSTLEIIGLPDYIGAKVIGKSSLARIFLDQSSAGGWIDPGFRGSVVLEMINFSPYPVRLRAGAKVGQFVFFKGNSAEVPYNRKKDSKYMNQDLAQGSLYYKNDKNV
jgi:dCTP deaminase